MAGTVSRERILAAEVRQIELDLIKKYLIDESEENKQFRKDLILKLANNILPRKNEVTGEDGEPVKFNLINYGNLGSAIPVQTSSVSTGDSESSSEV